MVSSAGQNTVSQVTIMATPIPLPPLFEQRRIVAEVERRLSIAGGVEKTAGAQPCTGGKATPEHTEKGV